MHQRRGEGSICFNRLREWGYRIEPKADEQDEEAPAQGMDLSSRASGGGFLHTVNKTTLAEGIRIPIEQHALFQADPLPRGKSDSIEIIMDGHSFEGRLYHENPKEVDREMMSFRYKSNAELLEVIGSYFPQLGGTLRVVVRSPRRVELVPVDVQAGLQEAVAKARGRSVDELREAATGRKGSVKVTTSTTTAYVRSADVIAYVVHRADGVCEGCGRPAPFKKPNGDPYLEVHHIKRLAEGGADTAENAAGLCPNCHRRAHSSADRDEFSRSLREKISGL